jgi:hypothetical protein
MQFGMFVLAVSSIILYDDSKDSSHRNPAITCAYFGVKSVKTLLESL